MALEMVNWRVRASKLDVVVSNGLVGGWRDVKLQLIARRGNAMTRSRRYEVRTVPEVDG